MARVLHVYDHEQVVRKKTFLRGTGRFVISDDMTVKPASTGVIQSLPQAFGSNGIAHGFEELEVTVSWHSVRRLI